MQKFNYHTHTYRCGHAQMDFTDEGYVKEYIKQGFEKIAFTDHCPEKQVIDAREGMRMRYDQKEEYLKSINYLKNKYKGIIEIESGFEVEYIPGQEDNLFELKNETDKIIVGQHFIMGNDGELKLFRKHGFEDSELMKYAEYIEETMKIGLADIIAHPDLYMINRNEFGEIEEKIANMICRAAEKYGVPLEINLGQVSCSKEKRGKYIAYPCRGFWQVATNYNIKTLYGIDAHYKIDIEQYEESIKMANNSIGKDIIKKLNFVDKNLKLPG